MSEDNQLQTKKTSKLDEFIGFVLITGFGLACLYMTVFWRVHFYTIGVLLLIISIMEVKDFIKKTYSYLANESMENVIKVAQKLAMLFFLSVLSLTILYYFVYKSYHKENITKYCSQWATNESKDYYGEIINSEYNSKFKWCMNEQGQ